MSVLDSEFVTNFEDFTEIEIQLILKYLMNIFVSRPLKFERQKKDDTRSQAQVNNGDFSSENPSREIDEVSTNGQ